MNKLGEVRVWNQQDSRNLPLQGKRVFFVANTAFFVRNFLLGMVNAATSAGAEVRILAPDDELLQLLKTEGFQTIAINNLRRKSLNPIRDVELIFELARIYKFEKPNVIIHFTVKPNVFGTLAARITNIPSMSIVTGLGYLFIKGGPISVLARVLYKFSMLFSRRVGFLNPDDYGVFVNGRIVNRRKCFLLPGTGVDSRHFHASAPKSSLSGSEVVFLLVGRMLWDKGVGEFVEAARILKQAGINAKCVLLGNIDDGNPTAVPLEFIESQVTAGNILYWGAVSDVRSHIIKADAVVLPSYREGVPRSLLEAMSMEKPILASDAPGCRELVFDGKVGLMFSVKNPESLAKAMIDFVNTSEEKRLEMGREGRKRVLNEYDDSVVNLTFVAELIAVANSNRYGT